MLTRFARGARAVTRRAVAMAPMPQPPLVPTRHPVVLMHGFGALANATPGGILHAEAMHLRAHGVWAYAPHVNPYDTIAVRAASWADRLTRVLDETGVDRVNLVGFSLGGLDARHLVAQPEWASRTASIITVATPHRGTPLATYLLDRPARMRAWTVAAMDFVGRAAWAETPPHVVEALAEMVPAQVEGVFNPAHPLPEGIYCAHYAAEATRGVYPPLLLGHRLLTRLAGPNDGMVPTASMAWGEHLGTLDADHARIVGLRATPAAFSSKAFFLDVARHLRDKGF